MVTVQLDEITLNATRAALEERAEHLRAKVAYLEPIPPGHTYSEDHARALIWTTAALLETELARDCFSELQVIDHPVDVTWTSA